jgi:membrane protease YdiL (CAAX protease family)
MLAIIAFVWKRNPEITGQIRFSLSLDRIPIAILSGALLANASVFIQSAVGTVVYAHLSPFTIVLMVVLGPIVEEVFLRGLLLELLLQRHSVVTSVIISSILTAFDHESFWPALAGHLFLCFIYLRFRRSLVMSSATHIVGNLLASIPMNVLLYTHYLRSK